MSDVSGRAGPAYVARGASGMVFAPPRLLAGAAGFVAGGLLIAGAAGVQYLSVSGGAPLGLTIPVGLILVAASIVAMSSTNVIVARSVVAELVEGRHQSFREGLAFAWNNLSTIVLYPLAFTGLVLAAVLAIGLLTFVSAIPVVGNLLYGLVLFPVCVLLAIAAIVLVLLFGVTAFVFPGHVAAEQGTVRTTIRDLIRLARSRWASLIWAQLLATLAAAFLGVFLLYIGIGGILSTTSLWGAVQLARDFGQFDIANLPYLLQRIGGSGDVDSFAAVMVAFWLAVFALAFLSFVPTYLSTAGALAYLDSVGVAGSMTAHHESPACVLLDVGGAAGRQRITVPKNGVRIGRGQDCDVVVQSDYASSTHLLIVPGPEGRLQVKDLQSTNGTFVNGERVTAIDVGPGDEIRLGNDPLARFTVTPGPPERQS